VVAEEDTTQPLVSMQVIVGAAAVGSSRRRCKRGASRFGFRIRSRSGIGPEADFSATPRDKSILGKQRSHS
jgi:hypothetical protein